MENRIQRVDFICDGDRRWAAENNASLYDGYARGIDVIEPLVEHAADQGVGTLSFWAFSTDNWKRDPQEVEVLMNVFRAAIKSPIIDRLQKNGVQVRIIGDHTAFDDDIREGVEAITEKSKENSGIVVNFALNYGGQDEIVKGVNQLLAEGRTSVTKEEFAEYLYTRGQPNPDLIIRTGSDKRTVRTSGYMAYQSSYSEWYHTPVLWPDMTTAIYDEAVAAYYSSQRNFGR